MTPPIEEESCVSPAPCPYAREIFEMKTDLTWLKRIGAAIVALLIANSGLVLMRTFRG
jgi:hypothetical protein